MVFSLSYYDLFAFFKIFLISLNFDVGEFGFWEEKFMLKDETVRCFCWVWRGEIILVRGDTWFYTRFAKLGLVYKRGEFSLFGANWEEWCRMFIV